jgi:hypothetical protein
MEHLGSRQHGPALETIESLSREFGDTKFTNAYKNLCNTATPPDHISA